MSLSDFEKDLPTVPMPLFYTAAVAVLLVACLGIYSCRKHSQVAQATGAAAVSAATVAVEHKDAVKADAAVEALKPAVAAADTQAQGRAAAVKKDLEKLAEAEQAPVQPNHELEQLKEIVAAQKQTIVDLVQQVADEQARANLQADLAAAALKARDDWRATSGDQAAQIIQQQAVITAQKGLIAAAYIKGGFYGFGAGYAAGKHK